MQLEKLTFGVGDRFAHQASAQLRAFQKAAEMGMDVVPVWNKSNREHQFVGSEPPSVRAAAQAAVEKLGWNKSWYVDADHIQRATVDNSPLNLRELTPDWHAEVDPFRRVPGITPNRGIR